ncbi:unnamed protein product [Blepharisma stoltei]|uniref:Uncharacterized protein n=1 Tax=Blepharisma stoltei TaxID=1481888 RepID=A0AAU9IIA9_9CILI|nr:unnamed protein product [Blepharisma stoltei]
MESQSKKLFKFYRDQQNKELSSKRLFFYRLNRWRFDPHDTPRMFKNNKRGQYTLLGGRWILAAYLTYRVTLHYILPANPH